MTGIVYSSPVVQLLTYGKIEFGEEWPDYQSLGLRTEHTHELIKLIQDTRLHSMGRDSLEIWAPVHAWRALGQLKTVEAVGVLVCLFRLIDEEDDDWVSEELPEIMAMIGSGAIPQLSLFLKDSRNGLFARVAAERSLQLIGKSDGSVREKCIAILTDELKLFLMNDPSLNAFLIDGLIGLNAVEAVDLMREAFIHGRVDCFVRGDVDDVEIALGLKDKRTHPRGRKNIRDRYDKPSQKVKIGRNDPCHCGSGKKYKKCCLAKEEANRLPVPLDLSSGQKEVLIKDAQKYPFDQCLINGNWKDVGLARIVVIRQMDEDHFIFGMYLVDTYCLGVKSASYDVGVTEKQLQDLISNYSDDPEEYCLGCVQQIVDGAIEYAKKLGFSPYPEFDLARHVLGEKKDCEARDFYFGGPQGKPLYVAGPHDDKQAIIDQLTKLLEKDGFDYMIPVQADNVWL